MDRVKLKDVKKGDVFYECERGVNIRLTALEDAHKCQRLKTKGYACRVQSDRGGEMEMWECLQPGAYGLHLYTHPVYGPTNGRK